MSSLDHFHLFPQLPPEIQLQIWEHHFTSPQVHVIRRCEEPAGQHPAPSLAPLPSYHHLECTRKWLDWETANLTNAYETDPALYPSIPNGYLPFEAETRSHALSSLANRAAHKVAVREQAKYAVTELGKDISTNLKPFGVAWDRDMVYLRSMSVDTLLFGILGSRRWTGQIQRMAVRVTRDKCVNATDKLKLNDGAEAHRRAAVRLVRPFASLTELYLVFGADDGVVAFDLPNGPAARVDEFGFQAFELGNSGVTVIRYRDGLEEVTDGIVTRWDSRDGDGRSTCYAVFAERLRLLVDAIQMGAAQHVTVKIAIDPSES
ncbi:hypothetical protein F4779DRAFT_617060 [Xylariaceae sp. FL0662B]|nr:hypothetical protein F4779DRAFT_617060 [Xylariaceae sp. FL0662B]